MSSEYNDLIFLTNNYTTIDYTTPYVTEIPEYQILPKNEYTQYVVDTPIYYEQQQFSDFIDCEISMEESEDLSSNNYNSYSSRSRSPAIRMNNNPINDLYDNKIRAKSPNIVRNNNLGLDNYSNSYENSQYSQSNPILTRSNSLSSYSLKSNPNNNYSIINNNPISNNITPVMPVQYVYNTNNVAHNSYNDINKQIYNSPIKEKHYSIPKTLTNSTIYKNNSNSPNNNLDRNITNFQYTQPLYNFVPVQNYQYVVSNPFLGNYNGTNINTLNNRNNNTAFNNLPSTNNAPNNLKVYKTQLQNNMQNINLNTNTKGYKQNINNPNNILNQNYNKNPFAPAEAKINQGNILNSNSDTRSINHLLKSCSDTHYSPGLLNSSPSYSPKNDIKRNSSPLNLYIPGFDINKDMRGKTQNLLSVNQKVQATTNNLTTLNNMKNVPLNNIPNINTALNNNKNNNPIFNSLNAINNTKSNLYSKPSDQFSQYMLEQINKIRTNPRNYVDIFKKAKDNIKLDKRGNLYYSGKIKVALYKGQESFEEAISCLERTKPMKPLIYKKDLSIEISKDKNDFRNGDYLRKKINELIKRGIKVRAFWRDIINDAETNFLLMIVDDNPIRRGEKRKDVLNPEMKYIGINSGVVGKYFVCYTVLSDE